MISNLERYARSRDADTSWDAAASISEDTLNELESFVMVSLREFPKADHELVADARSAGFGVTPQRVRTVRNGLVLAGFVEASGLFHLTETGRRAQVWMVTS